MTESRAGFRSPPKEAGITVAEMADAREEGYKDGFKQGQTEGYDAGFASGQAEFQKKMEVELSKIRQLVQSMQHPFQDFRQDLVSEIKNLTLDICSQFLHHQVMNDQSLLEYLIDEAVKQLLPVDHQVVVHANQHNADIVKQALSAHMDEASWRLQLNNKLSNGNVFLESGHSRVKINLDALLDKYLHQLKEQPS